MVIRTLQLILTLLLSLSGCTENTSQSINLEDLEARAQDGDASAMVELSDLFFYGEEVDENLETSFEYAQAAADLGDGEGLAVLAEFYAYEIFVEEDLKKAFQLFEASSLKNSSRGQLGFAQLFDYGQGVDQNRERANYWYRQAIANGDEGAAYYQLAINLLEGYGEPANSEKALKLAREATELGYLAAHFLIGEMYQYGLGVTADLERAQSNYKICSDDGDSDCKFEYAKSLAEGTDTTPADADKAVQIMEDLANTEYVPAINQIGLWYDQGYYVSRDDAKAFSWYQRGAALEDTKSIGLLATMYHLGEGVEPDIDKALELYWVAASNDHIDSLIELYDLYSEGSRVDRDLDKAESVLKSAVELGSVTAMQRLATAYESGVFGAGNLDKAKKLFEQIIELGSQESIAMASRHIKRLSKEKTDKKDPFSTVDFGKYKALVIGINEYDKLNPLRTSIQDAQAVTNTLRKDYSFEVELLINPTRSSLLNALIKYRETLTDSDNFLLFYAGHGILQSETGKGFWQPADSDPIFETNWIAVDSITSIIKSLKARNTMVIADSCYSGAVFRSGITTANSRFMEPSLVERMLEAETRVALTSGGLEPVIDSLNQGDKNSIFTRALITALDDEAPVKTGSELFSQVASAVISETSELGFRQTPEYAGLRTAGHEGGDFIFRRVQN